MRETEWALTALVVAALVGCGDDVRVPNRLPELLCAAPDADQDDGAQPGCLEEVTVGVEDNGEAVAIGYRIRDEDGDDQQVTVEICEAHDRTSCGFAFRGGGDGGEWVPTDPFGGAATHVYHWRFGCGWLLPASGERRLPELTESLVARVSLPGTEEARTSEPFSLQDLGLGELAGCDDGP